MEGKSNFCFCVCVFVYVHVPLKSAQCTYCLSQGLHCCLLIQSNVPFSLVSLTILLPPTEIGWTSRLSSLHQSQFWDF